MVRSKSIRKPSRPKQKDLFGRIVREIRMVAPDSPKKAFYSLCLEIEFDQYIIRKESGIGSKVLDHREWKFASMEAADKNFNQRLKQKTSPNRKARHYIEIKI